MRKFFTRLPLYLGIFIFGISLLTVAFNISSSTPINTTINAKTLMARLSVLSDTSAVSVNSDMNLSVGLNADDNLKSGDIIVTYDPVYTSVSESSIKAGEGFKIVKSSVDSVKGNVDVTVAPDTKDISNGFLFSFSGRALKRGETTIYIDRDMSRVDLAGGEASLEDGILSTTIDIK